MRSKPHWVSHHASNPVTYIKAYDEIRKLWAEQPLAKQMGYTIGISVSIAKAGAVKSVRGRQ